jgi:hypothetical protein
LILFHSTRPYATEVPALTFHRLKTRNLQQRNGAIGLGVVKLVERGARRHVMNISLRKLKIAAAVCGIGAALAGCATKAETPPPAPPPATEQQSYNQTQQTTQQPAEQTQTTNTTSSSTMSGGAASGGSGSAGHGGPG